VIAIESTGSYAAALVRYLREHGVRVVEVNQPHAHTRRRRGKSDPIDAEMAARLFLAGKARAVPKQTDGIVESIRLLRAARHSALKFRSAALVQLSDLSVTAPQELRDQLSCRKALRGKATLCRRLRPSIGELRRPSQAAKFALRSIARRIDELDDEIAVLDRQLERLVRAGRAAHHPAARDLNRPRRPAARHCRTEHRTASGRSRVRLALRRKSGPGVVRQDHPPPPQLRRRRPSQPHPAPDRRLSPALLRAHGRLREAPKRRGQNQGRDHALPGALHRPRGLQRPPRRPRRLTSANPRTTTTIYCGASPIGFTRRRT
jgi:Transposase